ncbi:GNAT family N-acetyltransferase [Humibacter sp.]|jgi:ribosomal protein S18 acetylase RimI-like enzyme|uniref:GNAT family N-acetyltransferase n=1 Tax=Humibacter sp. TaxID=1940291 RepID=UPI002BBCFE69|nr:GNAT family N-acetyltransferase [Humibacter sp.]HVX08883.1 GNAT family N-acetyltransferase [Humibacter sp.]
MSQAAIRRAVSADADRLAFVAAVTFPLACPPHTTREDAAAFVVEHLSAQSFGEYLADPDRVLFLAEQAGQVVGYTMLVFGEPHDPDVASAITIRPTIELSKCYVLPGHHGQGVAGSLMQESIAAARERGAAGIWLGVNEENERAQRFYRKSGFEKVGVKRFRVGNRWEDDFVLEQALA